MTSIFHRTLKSTVPIVVGGEGPYLFDAQGNRYLDASGGAAVSCLGHQYPFVVEAIKEQAGKLAYAHTSKENVRSRGDRPSPIRHHPLEPEHAGVVGGGDTARRGSVRSGRSASLPHGTAYRSFSERQVRGP